MWTHCAPGAGWNERERKEKTFALHFKLSFFRCFIPLSCTEFPPYPFQTRSFQVQQNHFNRGGNFKEVHKVHRNYSEIMERRRFFTMVLVAERGMWNYGNVIKSQACTSIMNGHEMEQCFRFEIKASRNLLQTFYYLLLLFVNVLVSQHQRPSTGANTLRSCCLLQSQFFVNISSLIAIATLPSFPNHQSYQ